MSFIEEVLVNRQQLLANSLIPSVDMSVINSKHLWVSTGVRLTPSHPRGLSGMRRMTGFRADGPPLARIIPGLSGQVALVNT